MEIAKKGKGNIKRNRLDSPYSVVGLGHLYGPSGPFTLGFLLSTSIGGLTHFSLESLYIYIYTHFLANHVSY